VKTLYLIIAIKLDHNNGQLEASNLNQRAHSLIVKGLHKVIIQLPLPIKGKSFKIENPHKLGVMSQQKLSGRELIRQKVQIPKVNRKFKSLYHLE